MKLSKKYKIPIIEDHAQTVLATVNNKIVGVRGDLQVGVLNQVSTLVQVRVECC